MNPTDTMYQESPAQKTQGRNPWIAALMSLALPGWGQLYNGQVNRAIWLFVGFALISGPAIALIALYLPAPLTVFTLAAGLLLTIGLWIYGIAQAWRQAQKSDHYTLRFWQTSGAYLLVFILCALITIPLMTKIIRQYQVQPFRTPSSSMSPSLEKGDFFFADKRYNCPECAGDVKRGDIAVFVYPNNRTRYYVKRVIGLPGDEISITGHHITINGTPLDSSSGEQGEVEESIDGRRWTVKLPPDSDQSTQTFTVSSGHAFVLGDNRGASNDSRIFGQVPLQDIAGLARQIWFSYGEDGIRWDRLGLPLLTDR